MIQYISSFESTSTPPKLLKQFVLNGVVEMSTSLNISDSDELSEIPEEVLEAHKENILEYLRVISASIALPEPGSRVETIYPITNWDQIVATATQLCDLWYWQSLQVSSSTIEETQ